MRKPKLIRKHSSGRTEADRDVELFLANEQVDQIADYASRGRVYERLTDGELAEKWIHTFRLPGLGASAGFHFAAIAKE
jgi:hypothetical protein